MDALAEIRTKLAEIRPAALEAFGRARNGTSDEPPAREYLRLRNLELKLEREAKERERACRACGVPPNFVGQSFDTFETKTAQQRAAVDACQQFRDTWWHQMHAGEHTSLWILGPTGTGKTRLASALVTALHVDDCASAQMTTPAPLIRRLRDTWGLRGKEQALLNELADVQVLVLDDLGRSFGSPAEIVQITELIDLRYAKCHPTLITSNLNEPQLKKLLGERAFDRLRHGRRIVPLTGESYRRPAA